jgi:predicted transcriptional regulator
MNTQSDDQVSTHNLTSPKTKWGRAVTGGRNGYQLLPDVLVRNQHRLGLTSTEMVVLVNILMHWWESEPEKMPHPRAEQIAKRIGSSTRTVQRCVDKMCSAGLLEWMAPERGKNGLTVRPLNVQGLVQKLQKFAEETELVDESFDEVA